MLVQRSIHDIYNLGSKKYSWWQDWRGQCVAIVASGPSTKKVDLNALKDRIHVVAIKANVDLCPRASIVYGCDEPWWTSRNGLPNYRGIKIAYDAKACNRYKDIVKININTKQDRVLFEEPGVVGCGGNSGFQIFNLILQFGATGIALIGFDMNPNIPIHWYGRNTWLRANNPMESNYIKWRKTFWNSTGALTTNEIDVVNVSDCSTLECFPKIPNIEQVFKRWGL